MSRLGISRGERVITTMQKAVNVCAPFPHNEGFRVSQGQFLHNFVHTICMQTTWLHLQLSTPQKRLSDLANRLFSPLSTPPITTTITYIKTEEQAA